MVRHDTTQPHALLTDEPGLLVHRPRRKLAQVLALYAILSLICGAAGAVIAYQLSNVVIDRRVSTLEGDLAQRRATRAAEDQARDARLTQTRRDLCVVIDRVQPRDAAVEDVRRRWGCTSRPAAVPAPAPSVTDSKRPGASPTTGGGPVGRVPSNAQRGPVGSSGGSAGSAGSGPSGPTGPTGPQGAPAPAPAPAPPPPPPSAEEPVDLLDVCVPLLDLCV